MADKHRTPKPYPHRCTECGVIEVYPETASYQTAFKYEGRLHEFEAEDVALDKCRACKSITLPNTALDQIAEAFRSHAGLLTAGQIREELRTLELAQKDFAALLGVAPETVSRWLGNVQIQTLALDKLMRLFFKSAAVRSELAEMSGAI